MTSVSRSGTEAPATAGGGGGVMAAEEVIERVSEELLCAMCGSIFVDPRMLQCQHCFCLRCLFAQALHDRGSPLTLKCAFRCREVTTTTGDIRTLPRNPVIANVCALLRKRHMQALAEEHRTQRSTGDNEGSAEEEPGTRGSEGAQPTRAAAQAAGNELSECEWCSSSSPSCEVCPRCYSRLCNECRGRFGDHSFLCAAPPHHRVGHALEQDTAASVVGGAASADSPNGDGSEREEGGPARFPFLLSEGDLPSLIQRQMSGEPKRGGGGASGGAAEGTEAADPSASASTRSRADITIKEALPVYIACPLSSVKCTQRAAGFSAVLRVHPTIRVGSLEVQVPDVHWGKDDLGAEALLFVSNMLRLAHHTVKTLNSTSSQMKELLEELTSAARKDLVERNRGFQLFATHVASVARMQVLVARNGVLAHLVRACLVEGLMGDMAANRYAQLLVQSPVPDRHVVRQECVSFLQAEMHLSERLNEVMSDMDAVCADVERVLTRVLRRLRCLTLLNDPIAHPAAVPIAHPLKGEASMAAAARRCPSARNHLKRREAAGEVSSAMPTAATTAGAVDPIYEAFADFTFLGQAEEHRTRLRLITQNFLLTLESFLNVRQWTWTCTNTTVRSCGLAEADRHDILQREEEIQLTTDTFLRGMWRLSRLLHAWESFAASCDARHIRWPAAVLATAFLTPVAVQSSASAGDDGHSQTVAAGDAPPPPREAAETGGGLVEDTADAAPDELEYFRINYELEDVREGLSNLRVLRGCLLRMEESFVQQTRGFETQLEMLTLMNTVLRATQQHQLSVFSAAKAEVELTVISIAEDEHFATVRSVVEGVPPRGYAEVAVFPRALASFSDEQLLQLSRTAAEQSSDDCGMPEGNGGCTQKELHLADFTRRDMALSSCGWFGQALVDAAHGVVVSEASSSSSGGNPTTPRPFSFHENTAGSAQLQVSHVEGGGVSTARGNTGEERGAQQTLPVPPHTGDEPHAPSSAAENGISGEALELPAPQLEAFAEVPPAAAAGGGGSDSSSSISELLHENEADTDAPGRRAAPSRDDGGGGDSDSDSDGSTTGRVEGSDPDAYGAEHRSGRRRAMERFLSRQPLTILSEFSERLFTSDVVETLTADVLPTAAPSQDADGRHRAAELFSERFRFLCDEAVAQHSQTERLPFFVGTYRWRGGAALRFVADAQTGAVWMEKPHHAEADGKLAKLSMVGGTPVLLFILANYAAHYLFGSSMTALLST